MDWKLEDQKQLSFAEVLTKEFVGRLAEREWVWKSYLHSSPAQPLLVTGSAGVGKSTFLAKLVQEGLSQSATAPSPHWTPKRDLVFYHFVKSRADFTELFRLWNHLNHKLQSELDLANGPPPASLLEFFEKFPKLLEKFSKARNNRKLLLVLDGLDQIEEDIGLSFLTWLPHPLPPRVYVVLSSPPGFLQEAREKRQVEELELPPLEKAEAEKIVLAFLKSHDKSLPQRTLEKLLAKPSSGNPLYLRLCLEELLVENTSEIEAKIEEMGGDLETLLEQVLERLEKQHGRDTLQLALGLLAVSRRGLSEKEILALWKQEEKEASLEELESRWQKLYRDLKTYLLPSPEGGDSPLVFSHEEIKVVILKRLTDKAKRELHRKLSQYLGSLPLRHRRRLLELSYHLKESGQKERLWQLLLEKEHLEAQLRYLGEEGHGRMWESLRHTLQCAMVQKDSQGEEGLEHLLAALGEKWDEKTRLDFEKMWDLAKKGRIAEILDLVHRFDEQSLFLMTLLLLWLEANQRSGNGMGDESTKERRAALFELVEEFKSRIPVGGKVVNWESFLPSSFMLWWGEQVGEVLGYEVVVEFWRRTEGWNGFLQEAVSHLIRKRRLQKALQVAKQMENVWHKSYTLKNLSQALAEAALAKQDQRLLQQALQIAQEIGENWLEKWQKIEALANLTKTMAEFALAKKDQDMLFEALQVAQSIEKGKGMYKCKALGSVAQAMSKMGLVEQARQICAQALQIAKQVKLDYDRLPVLGVTARFIVDAGSKEQMEQTFSEALRAALGAWNEYSKMEALVEIGRAMARAGLTEQAKQVFSQALLVVPALGGDENLYEYEKRDALKMITQAMLETRIVDLELWQQAIQVIPGIFSDPYNREALEAVAQAMAKAGIVDLELWQQAIQVAEGTSLSENKLISLAAVGTSMMEVGLSEQGKKVLLEALEIAQSDKKCRNENGLLAVGKAMLEVGLSEQAKQAFSNALQVAQNRPHSKRRFDALLEVGKTMLEVGRTEEAQKAFSRALQTIQNIRDLKDKFKSLLAILQSLAEKQIRDMPLWKEAWQVAQSIEDDKHKCNALIAVSAAMLQVGLTELAIKNFLQSLQLLQTMAEAKYKPKVQLATLHALAELGQIERALQMAQNLEASQRDKTIVGIVKFMAKRQCPAHLLQKALQVAQSIEDAIKKAEAFAALGVAMSKAGLSQQARQIFLKALEIVQEEGYICYKFEILKIVSQAMRQVQVPDIHLWQKALELAITAWEKR